MIQKNLKVVNKLGLHARACMKLTNLADRYHSEILIEFHGRQVNARSIMSLMVLAASYGSDIVVTVSGEDEQSAFEAVEKLINDKFGEEG